jgi:mono/diheme cytochrome c family protein
MRKLGFIFALVFVMAGCDKKPDTEIDAEKTAAEAAAHTESVSLGESLFKENCSGCHTRAGRGDYLTRIPVTLLTRRSQQELMDWIRGSGQHREMPNFVELSDTERAALADYLLSQINR